MGVKVFSTSSRIPVKIGEVTFKLSPLNQDQKIELAEFTTFEGGKYLQNAARMTFRAIKYCVKEVQGLEDAVSGQPYQLEFDANGTLTDGCVSDLLSIEINEQLILTCVAFVKGVPTEIISHKTGQKLEGVEVLPPEAGLKKNTSVQSSLSMPPSSTAP